MYWNWFTKNGIRKTLNLVLYMCKWELVYISRYRVVSCVVNDQMQVLFLPWIPETFFAKLLIYAWLFQRKVSDDVRCCQKHYYLLYNMVWLKSMSNIFKTTSDPTSIIYHSRHFTSHSCFHFLFLCFCVFLSVFFSFTFLFLSFKPSLYLSFFLFFFSIKIMF